MTVVKIQQFLDDFSEVLLKFSSGHICVPATKDDDIFVFQMEAHFGSKIMHQNLALFLRQLHYG